MRIGVLGAGQLGRMLALAGYPLGLQFQFFDPDPDAPAGQLAPLITAAYDDEKALEQFARNVDLVTYEFENVPVAAARRLAERVPVYPPPAALEASQDRLVEKAFFQRLGIATAPFFPVHDEDSLERGIKEVGLPAILKTRQMGYDGKGQVLIREPDEAIAALAQLNGQHAIIEGLVQFDRELSILMARNRQGETAAYPLVQNFHNQGILRFTLAPAAHLTAELQAEAEDYARRVLSELDYVGVLAIEMFQCGPQLLANEMACRVHNSGHWTIEGSPISQFENHLRAIAGLPLGSTVTTGCSAMINLIGRAPTVESLLSVPQAHVHLYGKEPRPGRKLGHVTLCAPNPSELQQRLEQLHGLLKDDLEEEG